MSKDYRVRILLIDDEDSYSMPLAEHLRRKGYIVDTASDSREGLALLNYAHGDYDIAFVDQVLYGRGMDGIKLVNEIKNSFPNLPVVVVTGWGSTEKGLESLRSGAYRYISKSAGVRELELLIEMATEIKRSGSLSDRKMAFRKSMHTRVLVVFANPRGTDPLRLGAEDRIIHECVRRSRHRHNIHLEILHAATIHDVRRALLEQDYRIIHFSGHGTGTGLAFENELGAVHLVPPDALADFLSAYSPPLECVILNACYTRSQGQLLVLGAILFRYG
jgi:DNA-binding NarL/FixJ family response regulator